MKHITCEIEYDAETEMWVVTVYVNGHFDADHYFHTELAATEFAARRKLWGSP